MFERILFIINKLEDIYINKKSNTNNHKTNTFVGYSLKIFLNTLEYENELLKGQINLYLDYIYFYCNSQKTYMDNLLKKIVDFENNLESNILISMNSVEIPPPPMCVFSSNDSVIYPFLEPSKKGSYDELDSPNETLSNHSNELQEELQPELQNLQILRDCNNNNNNV